MKGKRRGIILCTAVLVVLIGVLIFQGSHHLSERETAHTDRASFNMSVTGDAAGTRQMDDGQKTDSDAAVSIPAKKEVKATSIPSSGKKKTTSPVPDQKKNSEKKGSGKKNTKRASFASKAPKSTPAPAKSTTVPIPVPEKNRQVSLTIQCVGILDDRDSWKAGVEKIIPAQGIFYSGKCDFTEGATAYDILKYICKEKNIVLDSQYTPVYGTYYIRGIGNLYEFDCGSESGWRYSVNGRSPDVGCSSYSLHDGDEVVFYYDNEL